MEEFDPERRKWSNRSIKANEKMGPLERHRKAKAAWWTIKNRGEKPPEDNPWSREEPPHVGRDAALIRA